jgi:hypothetical protein
VLIEPFFVVVLLMSQKKARLIKLDPSSGSALCQMVGSVGAVFDWNVACPTDSSSFSAVLDLQVVRPVQPRQGVDAQLAIQTFRVDSEDFPNPINQDRHTILVTASGYFYFDEKFRGKGHHLPSLPTSLSALPFITKASLVGSS